MEASVLHVVYKSANCMVLTYQNQAKGVAIKTVPLANQKACQLLKNQFKILQTLKHPNIIEVHKLQQLSPLGKQELPQLRQPRLALVIELANKGSLLHFIQKQVISLKLIKQIALQITQALSYTHSRKIAHRDIKLQNVLVHSGIGRIMVKICDFGLASLCQIQGQKILFNEFRGTVGYMAPEIHEALKDKKKTYEAIKTDCFSLGVLLFALLFKLHPFEKAVPSDSLYILIIQKKFENFWNFHGIPSKQKWKQSQKILEPFMRLIQQLICFEPSERLTMDQLLQKQFFTRQL